MFQQLYAPKSPQRWDDDLLQKYAETCKNLAVSTSGYKMT